MPRVTKYTSVTTAVSIVSQIPARRIEIIEDGSVATAQGIVITFPDDNFTLTETVLAANEPFILQDKVVGGAGVGRILGLPTQTYRAADVYCKVASKGTATTLIVTEYE